jgi:hypothetical protein
MNSDGSVVEVLPANVEAVSLSPAWTMVVLNLRRKNEYVCPFTKGLTFRAKITKLGPIKRGGWYCETFFPNKCLNRDSKNWPRFREGWFSEGPVLRSFTV